MKKKCQINYYGLIAEKMSTLSQIIELEWEQGQKAREILINKFPQLENLPFQVALDTKIETDMIDDNFVTISLLPPFAGG